MNSKKRKTSLSSYVVPSTNYIGSFANQTSCTTRSGKRGGDTDSAAWLARQLKQTKTFSFQSLSSDPVAFRTNGTLPFRISSVDPATSYGFQSAVGLPIFVWRLSVAEGNQMNFPITNSQRLVKPLIMYRLYQMQVAGENHSRYRWISITPIGNNGSGLNACQPNTEESSLSFNSSRIKHERSVIDLVYTAPTHVNSTLETGIVSFTSDAYAPPDEYVRPATTTIECLRANSGTRNVASGSYVDPDQADDNDCSEFWTSFMHRFNHPAAFTKPFPKAAPIMKWHQRWSRTFGSISNDNPNQSGIQHRHTHIFNRQAWMNTAERARTSLKRSGTLDSTMLYGNSSLSTGIFPVPVAQRWFFACVSASQTLQPFPLPPQNLAYDPTMDIRITNRFSTYDLPLAANQAVQTLIAPIGEEDVAVDEKLEPSLATMPDGSRVPIKPDAIAE